MRHGIDRARQGVNDRVSNIAYQNNRAYFGGVDRAGNTLDAYVNTRAGEAAIAGTTPDMIAQYQQDLAEFEEATKLDRMALQKVTAERTLSEIALGRAEGLLDTKFEDLATGGAIDAPATPSGRGRAGGGAGRAAAEGMDQASEATERARTALASYAETAMKSGENIQSALAGAFTSAEKALGCDEPLVGEQPGGASEQCRGVDARHDQQGGSG